MSKTFPISVPDGEMQKFMDDLADKHLLSATVCKAISEYRQKMEKIYNKDKKEDILTLEGINGLPLTQIYEMPLAVRVQLLNTIDDLKRMLEIIRNKEKEAGKKVSTYSDTTRKEALLRALVIKLRVSEEQYQIWEEESKMWGFEG